MSDLIEREDAIREMALMLEDISTDLCEDILTRFGYDTPQELATEAMSVIPSADRPQGEWENYKDEHRCSNCGEVVIDDWYDTDDWYNFCPNCGARMKGADDEVR